MKVGIIIQARLGSSRLQGKVLKKIQGVTVLEHVINRVRQIELADEIIIATTDKESDTPVFNEATRLGVTCFRGSEDNVLSRYYYSAKENNIDVVVRITSDCPLIDPFVSNELIKTFLNNNYDVVSTGSSVPNSHTFPRGFDTEVFSFKYLEEAFLNATKDYEKEHVTPYLYEHSNNIFYYKNNIDYSHYRLTLDTEEDFKLISKLYETLYKGQHNFYLTEILDAFSNDNKLFEINSHIKQKKVK